MRYGALVIFVAVLLLPPPWARLTAADAPLSPGGPFINTQEGKAVVLQGTASPDGRYAVAWTIRRYHDNAPEVDWSLWDAQNPGAILEHYHVRDAAKWDPAYMVRCMVVDLHTRRAELLDRLWSDDGCNAFPRRLDVLWGQRANGGPIVFINRVIKTTQNLDLVWPEGNDIMDSNLTPSLWGTIELIARQRRPAIQTFDTQFLPAPGKDGAARFRDGALEIPFHAGPMEPQGLKGPGADMLGIDGVVRFALDQHTTPSATSDAKTDNPFEADAGLHAAYEDYSKAREAVAGQYTKAGLPAMPDAFILEEAAWLQARDEKVIQAVQKAVATGGDARAAEKQVLLDALRARTAELKNPAEMKTPEELKEMLDAQQHVVN